MVEEQVIKILKGTLVEKDIVEQFNEPKGRAFARPLGQAPTCLTCLGSGPTCVGGAAAVSRFLFGEAGGGGSLPWPYLCGHGTVQSLTVCFGNIDICCVTSEKETLTTPLQGSFLKNSLDQAILFGSRSLESSKRSLHLSRIPT